MFSYVFKNFFSFIFVVGTSDSKSVSSLSNFLRKKSVFLVSYGFLDYFFSVFYNSFFFLYNFKFFYKKKQFNSVNNIYSSTLTPDFFLNFFYSAKSLWKLFRFWIVSIFLFFFIFYFLTYVRLLPFNKVIFEWFVFFMFVYWLVSGFVFFFKKYQFSKYTSVIQRFWKRSYILFWLIESGVFLVFFYLTLNATNEPVFMYDQMKLYKTNLFSWRFFISKIFITVALIFICSLITLKLKWSVFSKTSVFVFAITLMLLYVLWLEFYQFYHIISSYGNFTWVFNTDDWFWVLEHEFKRTRIANNYISLCLIAKFWHLVFIFVFWVFFVLRVNESSRVRYPLFSANAQNFIILYLMSWLYMYPWLKFAFKPFLDTSYYWFFLNSRTLFFRLFCYDLVSFYSSLFSLDFFSSHNFNNYDFFYFFDSSDVVGHNHFKKHFLRDYIISSFKSF